MTAAISDIRADASAPTGTGRAAPGSGGPIPLDLGQRSRRLPLPTVARVLLGLMLFVFGLNGFLGFIPPPAVPERAAAFLEALTATGYMVPLIKGVEVAAGALLLANRFVPLALVLVAPNVVNIVLFHLVLAPGGATPFGAVVLGIELYLAWCERGAFSPLLDPRGARSTERAPRPGVTRA
ncbi:hypothetical protein [Sorangium sp. So ce131]|uniref:hypothetical protein n=1 Tax=Sorangium sp. So ce131 TaxID=3133282 RepID=UPI003F62C3BB